MIARRLARMALLLYPRPWRRRYGDEVRDLLDSRRATARTVLDLMTGAFDAWVRRDLLSRHRRRIPTRLVLPVCAVALIYLWNPGVLGVPPLYDAWQSPYWARPAVVTPLAGSAVWLFDAAGALAAISTVCVLGAALLRGPTLTLIVIMLAAVPMGFFLYHQYAMVHFDAGFQMGLLGNAAIGGFITPVTLMLSLAVLSLGRAESEPPGLLPRAGAALCLAAARLVIVAWLPGVTLILLAAHEASAGFLCAMAASVTCSIVIAIRTASVLRRPPRRAAAMRD